MNIITKLLYKTSKKYYRGNCINIAITLLYIVSAIAIVIFSKSEYMYYISINIMAMATIIYFNCHALIILTRLQKTYKTVSANSKIYHNMLKQFGEPILVGVMFFSAIMLCLFAKGLIDANILRMTIVFTLLTTVVIKVYILDMIVIFSPETFCSGDNVLNYDVITKLEIFKRVDYTGADNIVYFEMYNGNRYLGFDKLSEYDYKFLSKKVNSLNYE